MIHKTCADILCQNLPDYEDLVSDDTLWSGSAYYPLKKPINDQVIEYDFVNRSWKVLPTVPQIQDLNIPDANYKCSVLFKKDGTR